MDYCFIQWVITCCYHYLIVQIDLHLASERLYQFICIFCNRIPETAQFIQKVNLFLRYGCWEVQSWGATSGDRLLADRDSLKSPAAGSTRPHVVGWLSRLLCPGPSFSTDKATHSPPMISINPLTPKFLNNPWKD